MTSVPPALLDRLGQSAEAGIDGLDRLDRRVDAAGMPDHVGIGVVQHDDVEAVRERIASTTLSVTSGADISGC